MKRLSLLFSIVPPPSGRIFRRILRQSEYDRQYAGDRQIGPAFRATHLVAPVDVELIDVNLRTASRTAGHTDIRGIIAIAVESRNGSMVLAGAPCSRTASNR